MGSLKKSLLSEKPSCDSSGESGNEMADKMNKLGSSRRGSARINSVNHFPDVLTAGIVYSVEYGANLWSALVFCS